MQDTLAVERVVLNEQFDGPRKLHEEEVPVFTKKEYRHLRKLIFHNASCAPFTERGVFIPTQMGKVHSAFDSIVSRTTGETKQEELYASAGNSTAYSTGQEIIFTGPKFVTPDPNGVRNSMGRRSSTVFRIIKPQGIKMLALPRDLTNFDSIYLMDANTRYEVVSVHIEDWDCHPRISCPSSHQNVQVVTLKPL